MYFQQVRESIKNLDTSVDKLRDGSERSNLAELGVQHKSEHDRSSFGDEEGDNTQMPRKIFKARMLD